MTTAKHYYESHITIDPVFDNELEKVTEIAQAYNFRVASLLMQKRKEDTPERSKYDTFMTGHSKDMDDIMDRTSQAVTVLQHLGFKVRRYKIEDTMLDSRIDDELHLLRE